RPLAIRHAGRGHPVAPLTGPSANAAAHFRAAVQAARVARLAARPSALRVVKGGRGLPIAGLERLENRAIEFLVEIGLGGAGGVPESTRSDHGYPQIKLRTLDDLTDGAPQIE